MAERDSASTFSKGLRVLACFESGQRGYTMAQIARNTGFDRATTRRLCLSLLETGYLSRNDQHLSLTPKILSVAGGFLAANDIGRSVQPILNQFAGDLGSDISLAVRDGDRAIYIAQSTMKDARISIGFTVGSTLPLLHTSIGRMILAGCTPQELEDVFRQVTPKKYSEQTELDPDVIREEIAGAAKQGFAYVENEFEMGAAALAVPVGTIAGNPAVVGSTNSFNKLRHPDAQDQALDALRRTAFALRRLAIVATAS